MGLIGKKLLHEITGCARPVGRTAGAAAMHSRESDIFTIQAKTELECLKRARERYGVNIIIVRHKITQTTGFLGIGKKPSHEITGYARPGSKTAGAAAMNSMESVIFTIHAETELECLKRMRERYGGNIIIVRHKITQTTGLLGMGKKPLHEITGYVQPCGKTTGAANETAEKAREQTDANP